MSDHTPKTDAPARRALVLGLGVSGLSIVQHLRRCGAIVRAADTRHPSPNAARVRQDHNDVAVCEGPFVDRLLDDIDLVALSPGISVDDPLVLEAYRRGLDVVGDVELFARAINAGTRNSDPLAIVSDDEFAKPVDNTIDISSVLGITGSNGKSTVTALTGEILKHAKKNVTVGGNIGQPVLTLRRHMKDQCFVLELSSFQLETVSTLKLRAATLLNLSEDHLDRHATLQRYGEAKARIFKHADVAVVNRHDSLALSYVPPSLKRISFGTNEPETDDDFGLCVVNGQEMIVQGTHPLMSVQDSPLPGRHNTLNIMASLALASVLNVKPEVGVEAVRSFQGLPHRMQTVASVADITWINDSKGTNVGSTLAAVEGLDRPMILIAGGQSKGQDFAPLMQAAKTRVRELILMGEDAHHLSNAAKGYINNVTHVSDLAQAVQEAARMSRSGDIVLFSPACASFDMFENFMARGDAFCELVRVQLRSNETNPNAGPENQDSEGAHR